MICICETLAQTATAFPLRCACGRVWISSTASEQASAADGHDCRYRSEPIGQLKRSCSSCNVYRCAKYSTLCTLTTPSEYGLPVLVDGKPSEERVMRDNSRQCSLCVASGEDG